MNELCLVSRSLAHTPGPGYAGRSCPNFKFFMNFMVEAAEVELQEKTMAMPGPAGGF